MSKVFSLINNLIEKAFERFNGHMTIVGPLPETVYCWEMNSEKNAVPVSKNVLNEDYLKRLSKGDRISLSAARPVQLQIGKEE